MNFGGKGDDVFSSFFWFNSVYLATVIGNLTAYFLPSKNSGLYISARSIVTCSIAYTFTTYISIKPHFDHYQNLNLKEVLTFFT